MDTMSRKHQGSPRDGLPIGDLAARTGVAIATLRAWEARHGFPAPARSRSGHRRYDESTVDAVRDVVRRREAGVRLDVAIAEAVAALARAAEPPARSVYAELRRLHPGLATHRLRKSTLLALSWAIEDEFCARAGRPRLFGAFQRERYWQAAEARWHELARVARSTIVYADFDPAAATDPVPGEPALVPLTADSPMRREWVVVCDSAELPAALAAWEVAGQAGTPDRDRVFESVWTVEPTAVRDAARAAAAVAATTSPAGAEALHGLADEPVTGAADLGSVTAMFNRVVAYVDRYAVR